MLKPWHKEQQWDFHSTLSEKYFESMSKWRRWQLRTPPSAASSGKSEQLVMKHLPRDMLNLYPPLSPCCCSVRPASSCSPHLNTVPYPLAKSSSQHPCPNCHFYTITCWFLMSKPDIGRQSKHIRRKPVSQPYWAAKKGNKALPTTAVIKTCTPWGWLLPHQVTGLQPVRRLFGEEKASLRDTEREKLFWKCHISFSCVQLLSSI